MSRFIVTLCLSGVLLSACGGDKQKAEEEKPAEAKVEEKTTEGSSEAITAEMLAQKYNLEAGKTVYEQSCQSCHMMGVAGAPIHAKKEAWSDRVSLGMDMLIKKSIDGYTGEVGMMPAKGGNPELSDEQVADAVAYMISEVI